MAFDTESRDTSASAEGSTARASTGRVVARVCSRARGLVGGLVEGAARGASRTGRAVGAVAGPVKSIAGPTLAVAGAVSKRAASAIVQSPATARLRVLLAPLARALAAMSSWLSSTWPARLLSANLARRIFVANLLGLTVLLTGVLLLNQHQEWLITAKRESLRVQGEIIAAALAASATVETDRLTFDPERLREVEAGRVPYRDDGFASLELALPPEKVGPVIRRLMKPAPHTRARVYDRYGGLILDTWQSGNLSSQLPVHDVTQERVRVKTLWTRIRAFFDASDLHVYSESGAAYGHNYPEVREAMKGRAPAPMLLLDERGKQIVALVVPIQRRGGPVGALLISTKPGEIDDILAKERRIIFSLAAMALLTTLMASLMLSRQIADPVRRLSESAEQVTQSINARADLPDYADRRDEVGQMAQSFKRMTTALYRRIEASEKFAADVAHELKNPLTAARATAETIAYAKTPEQRDELVAQINGELKRLNRLITDVSNASRLDAELARQETEPLDVAKILGGVVSVLRDINSENGIDIALRIDDNGGTDPLVVNGHEGRIGQVVTNLLDNAISFSKPGDTVTVTARRYGGEIEVSIEDQGPGMPDDKLEAVFDRFYSDRPGDRTQGKNSGLGLSISREIIAAHSGRIWAENRRSGGNEADVGGARFTFRLPADTTSSMRGQAHLGWL